MSTVPTISLLRSQYPPEEEMESVAQKEQQLKHLTAVNRSLIAKLKQLNDELTERINKQKPTRNIKSIPIKQDYKEHQSTKKELANAYKQIDMYKAIITSLKAKQVPLEAYQRAKDLEVMIKNEDAAIEQYHREIKFLTQTREKQEKQLKIIDNPDVKDVLTRLDQQIEETKQKIKNIKKQSKKRQQIQKKQHAYHMELEMALRKQAGQYYPGKTEAHKKDTPEEDIPEDQWQKLMENLTILRKKHEDYSKKIDMINKVKLKELKSSEENQLTLKEKHRKIATLKSKVVELRKLIGIRQQPPQLSRELLAPISAQLAKGSVESKIKKWGLPITTVKEAGKIEPNSQFFTDKPIIRDLSRVRVVGVEVWLVSSIPVALRFKYKSQDTKAEVLGNSTLAGLIPLDICPVFFGLEEGDYLTSISGRFHEGYLNSLFMTAKSGKSVSYEGATEGQKFSMGSPIESPSCFFGAWVQRDDEIRVCHLGCQLEQNW